MIEKISVEYYALVWNVVGILTIPFVVSILRLVSGLSHSYMMAQLPNLEIMTYWAAVRESSARYLHLSVLLFYMIVVGGSNFIDVVALSLVRKCLVSVPIDTGRFGIDFPPAFNVGSYVIAPVDEPAPAGGFTFDARVCGVEDIDFNSKRQYQCLGRNEGDLNATEISVGTIVTRYSDDTYVCEAQNSLWAALGICLVMLLVIFIACRLVASLWRLPIGDLLIRQNVLQDNMAANTLSSGGTIHIMESRESHRIDIFSGTHALNGQRDIEEYTPLHRWKRHENQKIMTGTEYRSVV